MIYAGFGSFCDFSASKSRGWVLGWSDKTLKPIASAELNDTQATSPTNFFLSSVWMSGFGLAGSGGTIYFSTGNSDCNFYVSPEACPSQSTYDGVTNIQESVIGMDATLSTRESVFTPSNVFAMDIADADLGAAGVMLMPSQRVGANLAAIVSKDARLWLLDGDNLASILGYTSALGRLLVWHVVFPGVGRHQPSGHERRQRVADLAGADLALPPFGGGGHRAMSSPRCRIPDSSRSSPRAVSARAAPSSGRWQGRLRPRASRCMPSRRHP